MHDFPGLKPACSLIRSSSSMGAILLRMSLRIVCTCDIGGILVYSSSGSLILPRFEEGYDLRLSPSLLNIYTTDPIPSLD